LVVYSSPSSGDVYPIVPTLLELGARRQRIAVRTFARAVEHLRALGIEARAVDERVSAIELGDWRAKTPGGAIRAAMNAFARRAPLEAADLRDAIACERPDALLVDINAKGAALAAECSGLPWAMYASFPLYLRSRDAPPFGPGLRPLAGRWGRARDVIVRRMLERPFEESQRALNALRIEAGLAPLPAPDDFLRVAPLLLSYTASPLEYEHSDWPASVRLVGPGLWEPPLPAPPDVADDGRPIVLVTASSDYQNDRRLIETALLALADEPVWVLVTSAAHDPVSFRAPPNARVQRAFSHRQVLPRAACVVCHGGMGITQKALAAGVPICAVPFGRDQHEVARRVQVAGAGVRLPSFRLSAGRLRSGVRSAVRMRPGAASVAAAFAAIDGPRVAADALEDLFDVRSTEGRPVTGQGG
jgi:MGT family glycosyltransferase